MDVRPPVLECDDRFLHHEEVLAQVSPQVHQQGTQVGVQGNEEREEAVEDPKSQPDDDAVYNQGSERRFHGNQI